MATVIKASDAGNATSGAAFNFDDMGRKADAYVAQVRAEAGKIVEQARAEATAVRQRAAQEGRAAAEREIASLVEARVAERMQRITPTVAEAVRALTETRAAWLSHWQQVAVRVAAAIAARVIRRELSRQPEITLDLVREALELAAGSPDIRLVVHPDDFAALGDQMTSLVAELGSAGAAQVVPDASLSPGGCRVETRFGVIDQQIEAQLARINEELS